MNKFYALLASLFLVVSCNKVTTQNSKTPVVFDGIKSVDTTSKGTAVLIWDQPRGGSISGFEIFFEDLTASDSDKTATTLALADASGLSSQDVPAVLVDLPDEQSPMTTGKLLRAIDKGLSTYEIPKLLPGRYAIQVKAVGVDGATDANQRVAILKVESTLGYEGISKAEAQGQNAFLEWPQLETTLTSRDVVYTIFEGATFANPLAITTTLNFKLSLLGYTPGKVLYFGVRSTDAKGRTDRNVKTIALTVPSGDSGYQGCVSGEARGSDRMALTFAWPAEPYQTMRILRDGVQVFSTSDTGVTSFIDTGLQEGEAYTYTCLAVLKDRTITGLNALKLTTLTSNPPTFKGVASVDILSAHRAIVKWGVVSGVPAATFKIYMTPGTSVNWNADPVATINADTLSWTTNALGDDLSYAFGVRACSVKNVCDFKTVQLTGATIDDGIPKTIGATALAVVNSRLRVTAPWDNSQGGIYKRLVYMKSENTSLTPPRLYELVATVAVSDPANPPTDLFVQPISDNTTYSVIVYDQDVHGNKTAGNAPVVLFSGDTHAPIFGGIATVSQGVGVASDHAEETTLRLNFTPIMSEPGDLDGATDYIAYVAPGTVNACNLTTGSQFYHVIDYQSLQTAFVTVTGLQPLTTYSVCLKARDLAGNISNNIVSFTKSTLDITPPVFDGVQTVTYDREKGELALTWNPSTSADIYEYRLILWKGPEVDPSLTVSSTTTVSASAAGAGTHITQATFAMASGDRIHAWVEACDNAGSVAGGTQNCSVHPYTSAKFVNLPDIDPPHGFLGIRSAPDLISTIEGTITVKWNAPADWSEYRGVKVYYVDPTTNAILSMAKDCPCSGTSCLATFNTCQGSNTDVFCNDALAQCNLTGLDPFRTYRLHVRAYDDVGNMTILDPTAYSTNKRAVDTHAPNFTSNLTLAFANGKADFAWNAASDNQYPQEPGADITYEIYRKSGIDFAFTPSDPTDLGYPNNDSQSALMTRVSSAQGRSWSDTGGGTVPFTGGTTFYYTMCAVDSSGNRFCDGIAKSFLCPDLVPPVITSFTRQTVSSYQWNLNWVAADPGLVTPTANLQYKIYEKDSALENDPATVSDSLVYIATGVPTFQGLRGPMNNSLYIHYMLVVADADGNKAYSYMTYYSDNKVTLTSVRSNEGPLAGGKTLVLVGDGFKTDLTVKIGDSSCSSTVRYSKKHILCTSPVSVSTGPVNVTVTNPDGSSAVLANAYTYCSGGGCSNICNKSSASWGATFASGSGTLASPWMICNVAHLNAIRTQANGKYYKMGENIDLASVTFAPLYSNNSTINIEFQGIFNGDNYVVSNWTYNNSVSTTPVGFFGIANYSTITNFGLINATVTGKAAVGILAGAVGRNISNAGCYCGTTTVTGNFATGTVVGTDSVGGLVGRESGTFANNLVIATVTGVVNVGGAIGYKWNGLSNIEFSGSVTASAAGNTACNAGGIVGANYGAGYTYSGMKTAGTVTCTDSSANHAANTGGFIGFSDNSRVDASENRADVTSAGSRVTGIIGGANNNLIITNTKNYGNIIGYDQVAGFIGYDSFGNNQFTDSVNYGNVTSQGTAAGISAGLESNGCCAHTYTNVSNYGTITGGGNVGGIIGNHYYATLTNVTNYGNIVGGNNVGGIAGNGAYLTIVGATSSGNITGDGVYVAGLIGGASYISITDGHSSGTISGAGNVGGIIGVFSTNATYNGLITASDSSATIVGSASGSNTGGLIGSSNDGYSAAKPIIIEKSRYTGKLSGNRNCGGIIGATNNYVTLRKNQVNASVTCAGGNVGGFIGLVNQNNTLIEQNAVRGTVVGSTYTGGFVGLVQKIPGNIVAFNDNYTRMDVSGDDAVGGFVGSGGPVFHRCYASGKLKSVTTQTRFGGFAGELYSTGTNADVFWDKTASAFATSTIGVGSTTSGMLGSVLYTPALFDGTTVWSFNSLDLPKLRMELP